MCVYVSKENHVHMSTVIQHLARPPKASTQCIPRYLNRLASFKRLPHTHQTSHLTALSPLNISTNPLKLHQHGVTKLFLRLLHRLMNQVLSESAQ